MAETIREAVAAFTDAEALKSAVSELQRHGFDRADISFQLRTCLEGHLARDDRDASHPYDVRA